jgi:hypothetical protein
MTTKITYLQVANTGASPTIPQVLISAGANGVVWDSNTYLSNNYYQTAAIGVSNSYFTSVSVSNNYITNANLTFNGIKLSPNALYATANAGIFELNSNTLFFTPAGVQRSVIQGSQFYALNAPFVGNNNPTIQGFLGLGVTNFGVGVTLNSNTVYAWEALLPISKTSGTTSHNISLLYGGTAVPNFIAYHSIMKYDTASFASVPSTDSYTAFFQSNTSSTILTGLTSAGAYLVIYQKGIVSIGTGGTFIPQYSLSAAPGGAYSTQAGAYFSIYPIGPSGSNTIIGTWQ